MVVIQEVQSFIHNKSSGVIRGLNQGRRGASLKRGPLIFTQV